MRMVEECLVCFIVCRLRQRLQWKLAKRITVVNRDYRRICILLNCISPTHKQTPHIMYWYCQFD